MELYLKWLQKHERQEGEEKPIGLLLCSEGNTEHIELLMLDEKEIRVAQYLTELPSKEWFAINYTNPLKLLNKVLWKITDSNGIMIPAQLVRQCRTNWI